MDYVDYGKAIELSYGEKVVFYKEYGECTGDFIAITDSENYLTLWKGPFGSCPGCDFLQSLFIDEESAETMDMEEYMDETLNSEQIKKFKESFKPFLAIPKTAISEGFELGPLLPKNTRIDLDYMEETESTKLINEIVLSAAKKVFNNPSGEQGRE